MVVVVVLGFYVPPTERMDKSGIELTTPNL